MTGWRVAGKGRALGADICHLHDPELLPHAAMRLRASRTVYDVHEDLALQVRAKGWIPGRLRAPAASVVDPVERWLAGGCDAVVAATPEVLARFAPLFAADRAIVVANAPEGEWAASPVPDLAGRPCRIVYAGGITPERGVGELVDAMADPRLASAWLDLCGPVAPGYLEALSARPGFARATYHGVVDRDGVRRLMLGARVGAAVLRPHANYLASRPIKIDEYLSAGLGVVASDFDLWRRIYGHEPAVRFVRPGASGELAVALAHALAQPVAPDRAILPEWQDEFARLDALYSRLLETPARPR